MKQNTTQHQRKVVTLLLLMLIGVSLTAAYLFNTTRLSAKEQQFVHCYEEIQHADGSIGWLGHPPTDEAYPIDPGETHVKTHCFTTWAGAADFVTGGAVKLPSDATQKDYEQATLEYSTQIYEEQLKSQQQ